MAVHWCTLDLQPSRIMDCQLTWLFECDSPPEGHLISNLNCISSTGSTRWMRTAALPTFRKAWGKVPGLSDRSRLMLRMVRLELARRRCDKIQRNPPLVEVDADIKAGTRRTCNASHPLTVPSLCAAKLAPTRVRGLWSTSNTTSLWRSFMAGRQTHHITGRHVWICVRYAILLVQSRPRFGQSFDVDWCVENLANGIDVCWCAMWAWVQIWSQKIGWFRSQRGQLLSFAHSEFWSIQYPCEL